MKKITALLALAGFFLATAASSQAALINNWINWTAPGSYPNNTTIGANNYTYATGTTGSLTMPNNSTVNVTFTGEIMNPAASPGWSSAFGTTGNSWWSGVNFNNTTFLSQNVQQLPTNSDRIAVGGTGNANQTLTFGSTVSNIVMNIWSLGRPSDLGSWQFNQPFVILSENNGEYGSAPYALDAAGVNRLDGYEGSGTIQFTGQFTSLSWQVLDPEFFAMWNIGVTSASAPSAVPEPGQVAASLLLLSGIGGYVFVKRRKAAKPAAPAAA
jgi:hypothetical protein